LFLLLLDLAGSLLIISLSLHIAGI